MNMEKIMIGLKEALEQDYEEYKPTLEKYQRVLLESIENNSSNVQAYSLLAIIALELREDIVVSFEYLEECYIKNKGRFTGDEFSLWATNKAYFYLEESFGDDSFNNAKDLLMEAVRRKSRYSNTYYALGNLLFLEENYEEAFKMFNMAYELGNNKIDRFCEAICYIKLGEPSKSINILNGIYKLPYCNSHDTTIAYELSQQLAFMGNINEAKVIIKSLIEADLSELEIANLMFLTGDIIKCKKIMEIVYKEYSYDSEWLSLYFYSLKQTGEREYAEIKLDGIIKELEQRIIDGKNDSIGWNDEQELDEYVISTSKDIIDIKKCYEEIFENDEKPKINPDYNLIERCYYINCPRHF